jgi:hypothetical protein
VDVGGIGVEVGGTAVGTGGSVGVNETATVGLAVGVAVGLEPHALMIITTNIRATAWSVRRNSIERSS